MIHLRPYQETLLNDARSEMRGGIKNILIHAPTGSGKTNLTGVMLRAASERGVKSWFVVHRVELLRQSMATFRNVGVDFGIIATGFSEEKSKPVQICSIGTLRRRIDRLNPPGLIVWDEVHHLAAKSWSMIYDKFPSVFHVGLSATPERLDGKGLGKYFSKIIKGPEVRWLISNGFLSDYRLVIPPGGVDATGVHKQAGDFNPAELAIVADQPQIVGNAVREYLKYARGKRAIARHVNIDLSKKLAAEFVANKIPAIHVDGKTPRLQREAAMDSFMRGETLVLTNVDLFSEGVDVPAVECVLDLRPTQSLTLCLQFWGRSLRPAPGKDKAIIIDMAGNFRRHGLPCEVREWDLSGRKKKKASIVNVTTVCPKCYAVMMGKPSECAECRHVFEVLSTGGREVDMIDGVLQEVDVAAVRRAKIEKHREISRARTMADFQALAKKHGYKPGWAWYRFNARRK